MVCVSPIIGNRVPDRPLYIIFVQMDSIECFAQALRESLWQESVFCVWNFRMCSSVSRVSTTKFSNMSLLMGMFRPSHGLSQCPMLWFRGGPVELRHQALGLKKVAIDWVLIESNHHDWPVSRYRHIIYICIYIYMGWDGIRGYNCLLRTNIEL